MSVKDAARSIYTIPIINFAAFQSASPPSTRKAIATDLIQHLHTTGFVQIINHDVPTSLLSEAFSISKQFFSLPLASKQLAPHPPGWAHHRGYSSPGLEKVSNATSSSDDTSTETTTLRVTPDTKESYEIGSPSNPDQPNIWPPTSILPQFQPFMTSFYSTLFHSAALPILSALALGLSLPPETFTSLHSGVYNQLRLLHYPPAPTKDVQEGNLAMMPAHTDWSTITLLFQDDVGGLQVESPPGSGVFVDVTPVEGAMVVNVGDLMMRWTGDWLRSTMHRVGVPERAVEGAERAAGGGGGVADEGEGVGQTMTKARYSIPYFVTTDPDLVVECLTAQKEEGTKYEPITREEYAAMRARMQY